MELARLFSNYDAVVFDAGGVILDWQPKKVVARAISDPDLQQKFLEASTSHNDWHHFDRGDYDLPTLRERVCTRANASPTVFDAFFKEVLRSLTPIPDTVQTIQDLKKIGKKLVLLSNMPGPVWDHLLKTHTVWKYFDGLVLSFEIRMVKPDRSIYKYLIAQHKLTPEKSIFFDDREDNVAAARAVGLHALQFHSMERALMELARTSR